MRTPDHYSIPSENRFIISVVIIVSVICVGFCALVYALV